MFRPLSLSTFFDGTLGAGGHSLAVSSTHPELTRLVGVDVDRSALHEARERLERGGWECTTLWGPGGDAEGHGGAHPEPKGLGRREDVDAALQAAGRTRRGRCAALVRGNHAAALPILRAAFSALDGNAPIADGATATGSPNASASAANAPSASAPLPLANAPRGDESSSLASSAASAPVEGKGVRDSPALRGTPTPLSGALLDLGVSSMQLDDALRGFSFRLDGPLDMRMGGAPGAASSSPLGALSARTLLETAPASSLASLFRSLGDLSAGEARRAAEAIEALRARGPLVSTRPLADALADALGGRRARAYRKVRGRGQRHPATRVFQAVRIAVNGELRSLAAALPVLAGNLEVGGRLAVISFHSLEDRVAKHVFRELERSAESETAWQGRLEEDGDDDEHAADAHARGGRFETAPDPCDRADGTAHRQQEDGIDADGPGSTPFPSPSSPSSSSSPTSALFAPLEPTKKDRLRALRAKQRRERTGNAAEDLDGALSAPGGIASRRDPADRENALRSTGADANARGDEHALAHSSSSPSTRVIPPSPSPSSSSGPTLEELLALADASSPLAPAAALAQSSPASPAAPPSLATLEPTSPDSPLALPAALLGRDPLQIDPWTALAQSCTQPSLAGKAFRALTKRPILPTDEEIDRLPRARSAKLRVLERIA